VDHLHAQSGSLKIDEAGPSGAGSRLAGKVRTIFITHVVNLAMASVARIESEFFFSSLTCSSVLRTLLGQTTPLHPLMLLLHKNRCLLMAKMHL